MSPAACRVVEHDVDAVAGQLMLPRPSRLSVDPQLPCRRLCLCGSRSVAQTRNGRVARCGGVLSHLQNAPRTIGEAARVRPLPCASRCRRTGRALFVGRSFAYFCTANGESINQSFLYWPVSCTSISWVGHVKLPCLMCKYEVIHKTGSTQ